MPREYIRVEGNCATLIQEYESRSVKVDDWLKTLTSMLSHETPLLPRECRKYIATREGQTFEIEQPPQVRTIQYHNKETDGHYRFTLAFPFCLFIVQTNMRGGIIDVWLYFQPTPHRETKGFPAPMSNIQDGTGKICTTGMLVPPADTVAGRINNVIEAFWASEFNTDYDYTLTANRIGAPRSYPEWEMLSEQEPDFWTRVLS